VPRDPDVNGPRAPEGLRKSQCPGWKQGHYLADRQVSPCFLAQFSYTSNDYDWGTLSVDVRLANKSIKKRSWLVGQAAKIGLRLVLRA